METDQQIILLSLLGWVIVACLAAVCFGWIMGGKRDQAKEDNDQSEYLADYSDLKMLKKQAGGMHNIIPMKRK